LTLILVAALIFSILAHNAYEISQRKSFAAEREKWRQERSELLSRIQRPDHLPVAPRPEFLVPERELDEWNQVGQIVIDPEYGLDD
jgi:hypothetical protein